MATRPQPPHPRARGLWQLFVRFYCRTSRALFGKTLSLMAAEAEQEGKWHGGACCSFINWLFRDPRHCANELRTAKYDWLRAS